MVKTIEWTDDGVVMIDQTKLPRTTEYVTCHDYREVADAIRTMIIRGAPAIGVAAAMGMALAAVHEPAASLDELERGLNVAGQVLAATRPTAVNLFWGIERMKRRFAELRGTTTSVTLIREGMVREA